LEAWAFRREKVLALLDIRAARSARKLSVLCRVLAEKKGRLSPELWNAEWRELSRLGAAILRKGERSNEKPTAPPPAPSQDEPTYWERVSRLSSISSVPPPAEEPPVRASAPIIMNDDEVRAVLGYVPVRLARVS